MRTLKLMRAGDLRQTCFLIWPYMLILVTQVVLTQTLAYEMVLKSVHLSTGLTFWSTLL